MVFTIKLYQCCNIFKYIKKKHWQDTWIVTRTLDDLKILLMKMEAAIQFIKTYKRGSVILTFAKVKDSIKHSKKKLHLKIGRFAMETEL